MQHEETMKEAIKYVIETFEGFDELTEQEREGIIKFLTVNNRGYNFRLLRARYLEALPKSKSGVEALRKAFYSQYLLFGGIPGEGEGNASGNVDIMRREQQRRQETRPNELVELLTDPARMQRLYRQKVYTYLVTRAFNERTTTYEEIANHFDFPAKGNQLGQFLSPILYDILHWCEETNQPKITSLVVRKSGALQGLPGDGFWTVLGKKDITKAEKSRLTKQYQAEVFEYFSQLGQ